MRKGEGLGSRKGDVGSEQRTYVEYVKDVVESEVGMCSCTRGVGIGIGNCH
jgi:hypothetical protein